MIILNNIFRWLIFIYLILRNGLLRPLKYHYFSFLIFAFLLSQYLLIISACLCFLSFDHAVPFRFSLFSTTTLISFNFFPFFFSIQAVFFCYFQLFYFPSHLFYISSYDLVFTDSVTLLFSLPLFILTMELFLHYIPLLLLTS